MKTKQVIVIRKDLNMRKGKLAAQACHASNSFITRNLTILWDSWDCQDFGEVEFGNKALEIVEWLNNSFKKVVVSVDSEEELLAVHQKALDAGMISHLITDNGATEFKGVLTNTCIAIGPDDEEKFIGITDHLPLL